MSIPSPDMFAQGKGLSQAVYASATAGQSNAVASSLAPGLYWLTVDTDCYWRQGATGTSATAPSGSASSRVLWARERVLFYVENTTNEGFIHVRPVSASVATLCWVEAVV